MAADPPSVRAALSNVWQQSMAGLGRLAGSSPARVALLLFALTIGLFTALLAMPWAAAGGGAAAFHDALFVATSAVTVTGLTPVSTAEDWSLAGQIVILGGIQFGGLGIITIAALLAMTVTRHLGLRTRLVAEQGASTGRLGETGSLIKVIVVVSVIAEAVLAVILVPRMIMLEGEVAAGVWRGIFYAISAFNNAGFVIHPDGLADVGQDPVILWTIMVGVFVGSLGFPVLLVLWKCRWHVQRWSLHARLTVEVTLVLLLLGAVFYAVLEWSHGSTLGPMSIGEKLQNSLFASVMMRSGGFSVMEVGAENSETMLITNALMFAGGGSASTAGGIKVTTIAVIWLAFLAEARGDQESRAHRRTVPAQAIRVAVSVVAVAATLVLVSTLALMLLTGEGLERALFESISAFATCGLTTGLTADLPPSGLYVLSALMFAGRIGVMTFAAALTIRHSRTRYRFPEGQPIIG